MENKLFPKNVYHKLFYCLHCTTVSITLHLLSFYCVLWSQMLFRFNIVSISWLSHHKVGYKKRKMAVASQEYSGLLFNHSTLFQRKEKTTSGVGRTAKVNTN